MKFSIIIPVRAINEFLRKSIGYLRQLEYKDFEVLILPDKPERYNFGGDERFRIIPTGTPHPAVKRNIGAKGARGDVLAFLDDDAYPEKDWLNKAKEVFEETGAYALGGPAMTPTDDNFLEKMSGKIMESYLVSAGFTYRHIPQKPIMINDYPTVNLFVKKDAFIRVGGFLQDFWPGEDTKLCLDLVKNQGKDFVYDPRPVVHHHRREVFKPHLKQVSRYGQHRGQFARIFPETSRLPSYFVPSLFTLGVFLGPLFCLAIPNLWSAYFAVLCLYFSLVSLESVKVALKDKSLGAFGYMFWGIFLTHIVYGYNFMTGYLKRPKYVQKAIDAQTGRYIEG